MKWLKVELEFHGPTCDHNVLCWLCNERPAVYIMNDGVFKPCWKCQEKRNMFGKVIFRNRLNWVQKLFVGE